MMEQHLYDIALMLGAAMNMAMALVLVHNNYAYRYYDVYRRSRSMTALTFFVFGIGFLMHYFFHWRTEWPAAASALTVSYFHIGAVLFGWGHISLLNPFYLTRRVIIRDFSILFVGITIYWTSVLLYSVFTYQFIIFFLHASYIAFVLYRTLYRVSRQTAALPKNESNATWWTDEARISVINFQRSINTSCHLIILFGLGSVAITACFPNDIWPYTILLIVGIGVFCYIFYALTEYGANIEAGTNATEDVSEMNK